MTFQTRQQAGERLAERLELSRQDPLVRVFAVPRGGVLVALPVARKLHLPLEVLVVHHAPGRLQPWVGVRTAGGVHMLAQDSLEHLLPHGGGHESEPSSTLAGCTVVLIDEGMQSGDTMLAAMQTVWFLGARKVIVAVPCASQDAFMRLQHLADEVLCLEVKASMGRIRQEYEDFPDVTDEEVMQAVRGLQESR